MSRSILRFKLSCFVTVMHREIDFANTKSKNSAKKYFMEYIILEKDLIAKLNISRSTLHRYKTQLGFPFIKIGGKTFYNMLEVEVFFNNHSSNAHKNARYARSK